jgi:hypothetical protein
LAAGFACRSDILLGDFWQQVGSSRCSLAVLGAAGVNGCAAAGRQNAQAAPLMAAIAPMMMNKRFICARSRIRYTPPRAGSNAVDTV